MNADAAPASIAERLQQLALTRPDAPAFEWFSDFSRTETWTWRMLHRRACAAAAAITKTVPRASHVVLALPQGLDFIAALFGCHYADCVPVPVYPPDSPRSLPRFLRIAADCGARAIVTTEPIATKFDTTLGALPRVFTTAFADADFTPSLPHIDRLALLQYTSGTTSAPKGVMISHRNLIANETAMTRVFRQGETPHVVSWLPFYHDMGLMGGLLYPVFNGIPATLLSTATFLRNPGLWLRVISARRATISPAPNFAYELCARVMKDDDVAELDLSSWCSAICGAEPVREQTVDRFLARFSPAGFAAAHFVPAYGMAESTLYISANTYFDSHAFAQPEGVASACVSCGASIDADVRIVDAHTRRQLPAGAVGEIWVKSASVGGGYWNQPALSTAVFDAELADSGESGYLRTGDLGFIRAGSLHVTGRIKELIILRGRNFIPQDIEAAVRAAVVIRSENDDAQNDGVQNKRAEKARTEIACAEKENGVGQCAAFAIERDGSEALVVAVEFNRRRGPDIPLAHIVADMRLALRGALSVDADDIVLVRHNSLPRTSSGKLQRTLVRERYLAAQLETLADAPALESS